MGLSREDFLARHTRPVIEPVDLGDGDTVYVRKLTVRAVATIRAELRKIMEARTKGESADEHEEPFQVRLVCASLCDAEGNRLLTDEDYEKVADMGVEAFSRIYKAATEINRLGVDSDELKKSSTTP